MTRSNSVAYWRQALRSHRRSPHIKRAELGGDGQSVPFEQALSNLAHAYLRDRAPQLLDHELGFQLLEKNEDNDRAVGIFGFRVGHQLLYAPVFFLNGELKGHELLYLKESDTFVPMKENWINYVLNRKPNVIGEEVKPNLAMLGVDRPNMDVFRESPRNKCASALPEWLAPAMPGLMHALGRHVGLDLQVPDLVKENADAATTFLELLDRYPQLVGPVTDLYGTDMIKTAIETAKTACSAAPKGKKKRKKKRRHTTGSLVSEKTAAGLARDQLNGKLKIWTYDDSSDVHARHCSDGLTEKQAQNLKRDGVFVSDERTEDEVSHAYRVQEPLSLMNPDDTGIYQVLCKPDSFEECLYIHAPFNARGTKPNGVLVRIDGEGSKAWTETHPGAIFVSEEYDGETYRDWFDKLPDTDSLDVDAMYVLLAPNGQGTSVFEVEKTLPAEGDEKCYEVRWRNRYGSRRPDHLSPVAERRYEYDSDCEGVDSVVLNRIKGNRFVARLCSLYCPTGTKALKIRDLPKEEKLHNCTAPCPGGSEDSSDPPALRPGSHVDLQLGIYKTSEELRVFNNGTEAMVDGSRMTPTGAMIHLIRDYGLREKTARAILKEASLHRGIKCRVKIAQPYQELGYPPSAPAFPEPEMGLDQFMGSGVPATYGDVQEIPVDGMQPQQQRPDMTTPAEPMMSNQIMQASQTGQKEVLDTSLLSNLLKGTQNETLIDRHLSNLMKGLDSLGRLLFNMYWHHDKFEDRYGGNNLPEMTDAMRNAFESLGDITLELKQKTVEPYPDEGVDVDLGEGEM